MYEKSTLVNRHSVDQLADVRAKIKALKDDEKALVTEISKAMGADDSLGGDQYIARQAIINRKGSLDTKAMEAAGIDVERYRKPSTVVYQIRVEEREREAAHG